MKKLIYLLHKYRTLFVWLYTDPYLEDVTNEQLTSHVKAYFPRLYQKLTK